MTEEKERWHMDIELPYYPSHLRHQKSGILAVGREFLLPIFTDAKTIMDEMDKARPILLQQWIKLAMEIESNTFIKNRITMQLERGETVTADDVQKAVEEERQQTEDKSPPEKKTQETAPEESNGGGSQYPGPDYMFYFEEKADNGMFIPICGRCMNEGNNDPRTRDLSPKDIDYCRNHMVPMAMCYRHRCSWFDTKENPERRKELRKDYNDIYEEYKDDKRFRVKQGLKPTQERIRNGDGY